MSVTATHINYFHICQRKLWLFGNGINMEHTSDIVYDGKLLHETTYPQRPEKYSEIEISATTMDGISLSGKVDFYDARAKVIHEIKRSDKVEKAHEWQVKFYIWLFELNDIEGVTGILEYPKLRQTSTIELNENDRPYLRELIREIELLISTELCPPQLHSKICKSCSYHDFCYSDETPES